MSQQKTNVAPTQHAILNRVHAIALSKIGLSQDNVAIFFSGVLKHMHYVIKNSKTDGFVGFVTICLHGALAFTRGP